MSHEAASTLAGFHDQLSAESLAPLWEVMRALAPREPGPVAAPALWRADQLRRHALTAGRLITAEQAERRVIVLENPALKGRSQATTSLYAGVQLILPGELAPTHRHTASALRLIMEGEGGYSVVDGEKVAMHPGDFIITPSWSQHDHGAEGDGPVIWLDGLDVPIVNLLNAAFAEDVPNGRQVVRYPDGDAIARYGSGLVPVGYKAQGNSSPLFCYPYARTREALEQMRRFDAWDPAEGLRLVFTDPTTGASPIPTMAAFMQLMPKGFIGSPIRSTDGAVYSVVEGRGTVVVGDQRWDVGPRDVFIVPGWAWHSFEASEDLVLFSFSDRPLQKTLGFWREQRQSA
ncbi:MAG: gentisate 1,2-dioxygenase [Alphaproteobacteria bacterium]